MKRALLQMVIFAAAFLSVALPNSNQTDAKVSSDNTVAAVTTPSPTAVGTPQKLPCKMPAQPTETKTRQTQSSNEGISAEDAMYFAKMFDDDCDGISNYDDNCPDSPSKNLNDSDGDGWGDPCDSISSDISVIMTAKPKQIRVGEEITYTITITNHGPTEKSGEIVVESGFPRALTALKINSAVISNGKCDVLQNVEIICTGEPLAVRRSMTIVVSATALKAGKLFYFVKVGNGIGDLKPFNNEATSINSAVK